MTAQHGFAPIQTGAMPTPVRRPATLAVAVWGAVTIAVLSIIGSVVAIVAGRDSIREYAQTTLADMLGGDSDLLQGALAAELDAAYDTLVVKAVVGIVVALLVLLFAVLSRNGSTGARIGLALTLVLGVFGSAGLQLGDADALPSVTVTAAALNLLLCLVVLAVLFLPATKRYAASR